MWDIQCRRWPSLMAYAILNGISCDIAADRWTVHTVKCVCVGMCVHEQADTQYCVVSALYGTQSTQKSQGRGTIYTK